jgi:competence protein ComEC
MLGVRIFWAIVLGFAFGIFIRSFFHFGIELVIALAIVAIALLAVSTISARRSYLAAIAIALIATGGGFMRMDSATLREDPTLVSRLDTKVVLHGVVTDEPDARENTVLVPVQVDALVVGSSTVAVDTKVLAQVPPHTPVSYGDEVRVFGTLREPQPFDAGEGRQFDYPKYLAVSGITLQLSRASIERTGKNSGNIVKASAIGIKQLYVSGLVNSIQEPEAGLAAGITVGDKRSIGKELSDTFRRVSLVHIIVLSGYNITVVITAIGRVVAFLPQLARFGISGAVVLFFILMTGGAASATRAGAMALIAMYARMSGRLFEASRALGAVSLVMILWNPYTLCFDPSFQLSVLATLGLIYFTPVVAGHSQWLTERFGIREITAQTLGTQLSVLPLLLYQNGQLSLVALPANLLALFPIPLAMFLSLVAAISGLIFGPLSPFIGFPAYALLSYVIGVATLLGSLPFAAVQLPAFSPLIMALTYAALFGGAAFATKKARRVPTGSETLKPDPAISAQPPLSPAKQHK